MYPSVFAVIYKFLSPRFSSTEFVAFFLCCHEFRFFLSLSLYKVTYRIVYFGGFFCLFCFVLMILASFFIVICESVLRFSLYITTESGHFMKHCGKMRKLLDSSNFSFCRNVSTCIRVLNTSISLLFFFFF